MLENPLPTEWRRLIEAIHHAPVQCVIAVTGGGASAIADLLTVPGGSRSVLEATVPYSAAALADWLGRAPERYCAVETALAMAAAAYRRGCRLAADPALATPEIPPSASVVGVACTAALVSDQPKKGEHRCHIALETARSTSSSSLALKKGARDRAGEEAIVGRLILLELARAAAIVDRPPLELLPDEAIETHRIEADPLLVDLRLGRRDVVWSLPGGGAIPTYAAALGGLLFSPQSSGTFPTPRGVLCGAFNPLHYGHEQLRQAAERELGGPVYFEMSLANVDKPPLDYLSIDRRVRQFASHPLAITAAPTFAEKSRALPGVTFVVGVDTAERVVQPRYYGGSETALREALAQIQSHGCRFLVAGRKIGESFRTLRDVPLPAGFEGLFRELPAEAFRADVSSTELRSRA